VRVSFGTLLPHFVLLIGRVGLLGGVRVLGVILIVHDRLVLVFIAQSAPSACGLFDSLDRNLERTSNWFHLVNVAFLESLQFLHEFLLGSRQTGELKVFDVASFSLGARFHACVPYLSQSIDTPSPCSSKDFFVKETLPSFLNAHGSQLLIDRLTRKFRVEMA
jgi:hypothetical protein